MEYTKNYQLPQWVESDRILMNDFNEAMENIDAGIHGADEKRQTLEASVTASLATITANLGSGGKTCRITWGSYIGNGKTGEANKKTISVDFYPVCVIIMGMYDMGYKNGYTPAIMVRGNPRAWYPALNENAHDCTVTWGDKQVSWWSDGMYPMFNSDATSFQSSAAYHYVVIGCDNSANA